MSGFLDRFRSKVLHSVWEEEPQEEEAVAYNDKIALGVLMWVVAEADDKFLPEEKERLKEVLNK